MRGGVLAVRNAMPRLLVHMTTLSSPASAVPVVLEKAAAPARVAVLIVTWNRKEMVSRILASLSRQTFPRGSMHVVVIDNASTDGTLEYLQEHWRPEHVVANHAQVAHEPEFEELDPAGHASTANAGGFASLTIVRNDHNFGGCGGFNTGFAVVEQRLAPHAASKPDYVWLVDDDADVPADALAQLGAAMASDPGIGLVGSRTVNIADHETTIETTIYLNHDGGNMCDFPPKGHPRYDEHFAWARSIGWTDDAPPTSYTRGKHAYHGLRSVDVVSACSMLARWDAVVGTPERAGIGFWDWRYFIYCDDADWCLRFGKAGWRVVLNLDAVVYHTPWNLKLTPARIYYAQRNAIWMAQKVMPAARLKRVTLKWMRSILRDSLRASLHRRLFHAEIIRRTALDAATGVAGKTGSDGPEKMPVVDALKKAGAIRPGGGEVALLITPPGTIAWGEQLIAHVREALAADNTPDHEPRWRFIVRHDAAELRDLPPGSVVYGRSRRSRLKKALMTATLGADAVVVFDQGGDLPLLPGAARFNVHIDMKAPTTAQLERDGWGERLTFWGRWLAAVPRCAWFGLTVKPYKKTGKYG